jgi:hypothetical protein
MRNFHRDFESLNEAYDKQIQHRCDCTINEAVTDDISSMHRENSLKNLRGALKKLATAHDDDYSNVTLEDVYTEMQMFAKENLTPAEPETTIPPVATLAGSLGSNHQQTPMSGIAQEGTDGSTKDLTKFEQDRLRKAAGLKSQGDQMKDDLDQEEKEKEENVEEGGNHTGHDACRDDQYWCEEDKECKDKVDEDFEKMISVMKAADQVQAEGHCGTHNEDDEDITDDAKEEDVEDVEDVEEAAGPNPATMDKSDRAFNKGLDAALKVTAKHNDQGPVGKMMSKYSGSAKVAKGVNDYMGALAGKLKDMAVDLQQV